jgi:hypothetical protein
MWLSVTSVKQETIDSDSTKTTSYKQLSSLEIIKQVVASTEVAKLVSVTTVMKKLMCDTKPIKSQVTNTPSKPQD